MAVRYNLAVALSAEFQTPLDPSIADIATKAKAKIMSGNMKPLYMDCDPAVTRYPRRTHRSWPGIMSVD
jgi:hypothetical protein